MIYRAVVSPSSELASALMKGAITLLSVAAL